jgi:hypothetical protein
MKKVNVEIELYELDELCEESRERAIREELDDGIYEDDELTEEQAIEDIKLNNYLFYEDGELANLTHYTKTGITELVVFGKRCFNCRIKT